MDRSQLRYLLNSGPSRVLDVRKLHYDQQLDPLFKLSVLNGAIFLKQPIGQEAVIWDDSPPIVTKIFLPYDRRKPEDGGESFVFTPSNLRGAIVSLIGEANVKPEHLTSDTEIISIFDRIPSFGPYLLRDIFERERIAIPNGYFAMPEREAAMIKQRMRARLRPLIATAFGGGKAISETSIERLVQTLWELKNMDELRPLVEAFRISAEDAPEVFYCWLGIAFFENEYIKLQPRLKRFATWMSTKAATRDVLPRGLLDHYNHTVTNVRKLLQVHWKRSLGILQEYTSSYNELVGASASAGQFIEFLRHSKSHFWTMGACLGCLEQSVEIWEQTCSRFGFESLTYERGNEFFGILNLVNSANAGSAEIPAATASVA